MRNCALSSLLKDIHWGTHGTCHDSTLQGLYNPDARRKKSARNPAIVIGQCRAFYLGAVRSRRSNSSPTFRPSVQTIESLGKKKKEKGRLDSSVQHTASPSGSEDVHCGTSQKTSLSTCRMDVCGQTCTLTAVVSSKQLHSYFPSYVDPHAALKGDISLRHAIHTSEDNY